MSSIKMIDQTEKSVFDLECAINKLLDENYFTRDYKGFVLYINSLEKYEILHSRLFRDIVQTDGRVDYFYRQPINTSYDHKLPCWTNILLYFIACNIDYENICSDPTIRYDSIFNPRYNKFREYIKTVLFDVIDCAVFGNYKIMTVHSDVIPLHLKKHFPIVKNLLNQYNLILNTHEHFKIDFSFDICITNRDTQCSLKDEYGYYVPNIYLCVDYPDLCITDKIHISLIGEKLDENIELILIQEYINNDSKICNRLSIQSKTFNNDIFQKFFINDPTY